MTWLDDLSAAARGSLNDRVRDALFARGVSEEQIKAYGLGYLEGKLPETTYSQSFIEWSGKGSKLKDTLVLPLTNTTGAIRGLQFRGLSREHSRYMSFFDTQDEAVLFGLAQAMPAVWESKSVYLVEGGFDLFPVQRVFPGVIATLTAKVERNLLRVLRRLVTRIWIGYDADNTGRREIARFEKDYGHEFEVRGIHYPRVPMTGTDKLTKDPGDLWETWGDVPFQEFLRPRLRLSNTELFDAQSLR